MIIDFIFLKRLVAYLTLIPFLPIWWLQKLIIRNKNVWVFGVWNGNTYSDNSKALFEYVNQYHKEIISIWLTRDKFIQTHLRKIGYRCYLSYSFRGIIYSLLARTVIISCGKSDVNKFFINGAKIFDLWHGAPMKKIGLDEKINSIDRKSKNRELDNNFFWKILPKYIFTMFDEYKVEYLLSTSKSFSNHLQSAFNLKSDQILLKGYPRNDIFLNHREINEYKKGIDFLIMYLPTFRSGMNIEKLLFGYDFSLHRINKLLDEINGRLIIKAHYASGNNLNDLGGRVISLDKNPLLDINHILKDADLLITDYSGCYFDYLLINRPIIFTPFDYEEYLNNDRELYFKYDEIIAGPKTKDWTEVEKEILEIYKGNDTYKEKRIKMNNKFNEYKDSNSSRRIFEFISKY